MPNTPLHWIFRTKYRKQIAAAIFTLAVLLITRFDYFYHSDLYSYGLTFSEEWYWTYQVLYFLMWQALATILFLYHRSKRLFGFTEIFVLTGTQDLIYFAVWNTLKFPTGDWTWMLQHKILGFWTTELQLAFSTIALLIYTLLALAKNEKTT